jgi:hypothetical protein
VANYADRPLFVVRYMPSHKNSLYAAAVLEEARQQGKFNEALDILFEKQPEWGGPETRAHSDLFGNPRCCRRLKIDPPVRVLPIQN